MALVYTIDNFAMKQKTVFNTILLNFIIFLALFPFLVVFNDFLTKLIEKIQIYSWIQEAIVPYEVSMVKILTTPLGVSFNAYSNGMIIKGTFLEMTWNCIGWQSLLLLFVTFLVGLRAGNYTLSSKMETIAIGLMGTFLMNLVRLSLIVLIFSYLRPIYAFVYHDYLAAIFTMIWLFWFWWFAYKFVLEEKEAVET